MSLPCGSLPPLLPPAPVKTEVQERRLSLGMSGDGSKMQRFFLLPSTFQLLKTGQLENYSSEITGKQPMFLVTKLGLCDTATQFSE